MAKKIILKTKKTTQSVSAFLNAIEDLQLRKDCKQLKSIFEDATGVKGKMWGDSIVGYGSFTYHRSNGDEGEFMASGFAARKSGPTVYIMPGYNDYSAILKNLGVTCKLGKSCLYLKNLEGIHVPTLTKLIKAGLKDLKKTHAVTMK